MILSAANVYRRGFGTCPEVISISPCYPTLPSTAPRSESRPRAENAIKKTSLVDLWGTPCMCTASPIALLTTEIKYKEFPTGVSPVELSHNSGLWRVHHSYLQKAARCTGRPETARGMFKAAYKLPQ